MTDTKQGREVAVANSFAVLDVNGVMWRYATDAEARETAARFDRFFPGRAPHRVVRLTAHVVEEPIPEAKSGWEWRVEVEGKGDVMLCRGLGGEFRAWAYAKLYGKHNDWRDDVPPCDHAHVAALLKREGVE